MAERETPGQRIRNLREAAFITQKDFAERIGVAPSQLSRIESGETKTISSDILIAIATEFDVSTDYLLGLSDVDPAYDPRGNQRRFTDEEWRALREYEEFLLWKRKKNGAKNKR